jgi:hypothetical protein
LALLGIVAVAGASIGAAVSAIQGRNVLQGALAGMFSGGIGAFLPDSAQLYIIAVGTAAAFAVAATFAIGALWGAEGLAWAAAQAPVVGLSAAATSAVLNIPPVARALDKAGFWAQFGASLALTFAFQAAFANLLYKPVASVDVNQYIAQQVRERGLTGEAARQYAKELAIEMHVEAANAGGAMYGTLPGVMRSGRYEDRFIPIRRVLVSEGQRVGYVSQGLIIFGQPQHAGAAMVNLASRVEVQGFGITAGYLTWGISHQAFGTTLLQAGYAGSIFDAGIGFSPFLSTALYGPYGGAAFQALYNSRDQL